MSLLDQDDIEIVAFRPERKGETVEGVVTNISSVTSDFAPYNEVPVITLLQDDGIYRGVRGYHTVLRNELNKQELRKGDRLAVRYDGKKPLKNDPKKTCEAYTVRSERGSLINDVLDEDLPDF